MPSAGFALRRHDGDSVSLQLQGLSSGGTLTYSASGLPAGLSLNATTGLISGTIAAGAAANGPFTTTVAASNGTTSSSQQCTWTVNPVVTLTVPANQSNVEGNSVSLQVTATDSKNATLTYSATGLPLGLSISSTTGLISGTISAGDSSSSPYAVTVTASDGVYSSSGTFTWTITHTDTTTPTLTNPGTQDNVVSDSIKVAFTASDPDGDTFTYTATGLPDGLNIDPFTGRISGVVANDAVNTTPYSVTVTADDGNGKTVSQAFTWIVNDAALTAQGAAISAVEGNDTGSVTVATFTTTDLNYQAGDFTATVSWGDGSSSDVASISGSNGSFTVTDDHVYAEKGTFPVSVTITDSNGSSVTASSTATVADAALTLTGGFQLGDAMTSPPANFTLASFTDADPNAPPSDYSVSINWGDGTTSNGTTNIESTGEGTYLIVAPHSYANPYPNVGPVTYTVTVTLTDVDGASQTTTSTIVVGNLYAGVPASMGGWLFQDQNTLATAADFVSGVQTAVASINWGDGTTSLGTVTQAGGGGGFPVQFWVTGTHTYAQDSVGQPNGQYTITVTVTDDDGNTLTGTQYVSVVRPPITGTGNNLTTAPGAALNNVEVASFTVPEASDSSSEFTATIDWGDGNTSAGTIVGSGGRFDVQGSHMYAGIGAYNVTVTVGQNWQQNDPAWRIVSAIIAAFQPGTPASPYIDGENIVPGNSIYTYKVVDLGPGQRIASWTVSAGLKPAIASLTVKNNGTTALIQFKNTPAYGNLIASFTDKDLPPLMIPLTVVQVQVTTPVVPITFQPDALNQITSTKVFVTSTPAPGVFDGGRQDAGKYAAQWVRSERKNAKKVTLKGNGIGMPLVQVALPGQAGLSWIVQVELHGPTVQFGSTTFVNAGAQDINVGLIQHEQFIAWTGDYQGGNTLQAVATLATTGRQVPLAGLPPFLDVLNQYPYVGGPMPVGYYNPPFGLGYPWSTFLIHTYQTRKLLWGTDSPGEVLPMTSEMAYPTAATIGNFHYLTGTHLVSKFTLDVAATTGYEFRPWQTLPYWREGGINWTFNGDGREKRLQNINPDKIKDSFLASPPSPLTTFAWLPNKTAGITTNPANSWNTNLPVYEENISGSFANTVLSQTTFAPPR